MALLLLSIGALSSCRSSGSDAQRVAESFLDEHYVMINLSEARKHCSGLALQKVEDELRLVEGHVIDEATRQPKVSYSLREARAEGDDRATFVYDGTVKLGGDDSFEMRWLINTRRDANGVWSVSNFKEFQ